MTLLRGKSPRFVPEHWPEVKPKSLCKCFCELSVGFILWAGGEEQFLLAVLKSS